MADDWSRVDKLEATTALQELVGLVPAHYVAQAIDLFTTVHEYIVLAPTPIRMVGTVEYRTRRSASSEDEDTNSTGYDTATGIRPLDLTGPGEPLPEGQEEEIEDELEERLRRA